MPQILRGRRYSGAYEISAVGIVSAESSSDVSSERLSHQRRRLLKRSSTIREKRSVGHPSRSRISPTGTTPPGRTTAVLSVPPILTVASLNGLLPSLSSSHHISRSPTCRRSQTYTLTWEAPTYRAVWKQSGSRRFAPGFFGWHHIHGWEEV